MMSFDLAHALPGIIAFRIAIILLTVAVARRPRAALVVAFAGSALASLVSGLMAMAVVRTGAPAEGVLLAHQASGFTLTYTVDGLSAWFLAVLAVLAIPIAVFSTEYIARTHYRDRAAFVGIGFNVLLGALEIVFAAGDVIAFLFAWELFTLVTAALVATEHEKRANRRAAFLYLVMSHVGTGCLLAGFLTLAAFSGSFSFATILSGQVVPEPVRNTMFALFLVGFGVKAGVIPLHVWLPEAHPSAPANISALLSAVVIKAGIYGIMRVCAFGLGTPTLTWGVIIITAGAVSAILGVLYALMQHDLKRLLAYHSIENIGIILLGLGAAMLALTLGRGDVAALGMAASLFHVLNHALFKGLLFLGAGSVLTATGTAQIELFGGLLRRMPWTGLFFLVGAMAISGLPPLNGFASEWLTFQAFLFGFRGSADPPLRFLFPVAGALLALTTALAAACFVKAFGISFLARPRSEAADAARESPAAMLVPQAFLAMLCVMFGLFPGVALRVLAAVMTTLPGLQPPADMGQRVLTLTAGTPGTLTAFDHVVPTVLGGALIVGLVIAVLLTRRAAAARPVPTWGCGGELTARTEYTATAFSKPLMMVFAAIYRPTREVEALARMSPYFPQEVRYHAEIEPTFERYLYQPLVRGIWRVAAGMKVLQAGSLHAYLAYVIALVISLVLLVWWRR
jgi:hydrogenase-4 component B